MHSYFLCFFKNEKEKLSNKKEKIEFIPAYVRKIIYKDNNSTYLII